MEERQEEKINSPMVVKDPVSGHQLYGFSQVSLDRLNRSINILLLLGVIIIAIAIYVIWKVEAYNIVGKFIARCHCPGVTNIVG